MTHAQYRLSAGEPSCGSSTTRFDDEWHPCCITIAPEIATGRAAGWYVPALGAGSDAGICCDDEHRGAGRHQIVTQRAYRTLAVEFTFKENGRGPELEEEFVLAFDGTFAAYRVHGVSEFGAIIEESFARRGGRASWSTPYDRGEQRVSASAFYSPLAGSPALHAI